MTDKRPLQCPVCPNPKAVVEARCPQCDTDLEPLRRVWDLPRRLAQEGRSLWETGAETEGLAWLTAAAVLTRDPVESRLALSQVLLEQGRYAQAQEVMAPVLAREPGHPRARLLQQLSRERMEAERQQAERSRAKASRTLKRRWLCLGTTSTVLSGLLVFFLTWGGLRSPPVQPPPAPESSIMPAPPTGPSIAKTKAAVAAAFPMIRVEESGRGLRLSGEVQSYRELAELLKVAQEAAALTCEEVKVKYESFIFYRVRPGDSLTSLAQRFYGRPGHYKVIQTANPDRVKDANLLHPGDLLMIPGTGGTGP